MPVFKRQKMIDEYVIPATKESPLITFNGENGQFKISGTSISDQSDLLFEGLSTWIDNYLLNPKNVTQLIINLDYFDISTSKHLLAVLNKLKALQENEKLITVEWHYNLKEDDMLELGQDYEMMVRLPFKYVGYKLASSPIC